MKFLENRKSIIKKSSTNKTINNGGLNLSIDNLNNINEIILENIKMKDKNKKKIYNEKANCRNKKIKDLFANNSLNENNYDKMNRSINLNSPNNRNIFDNSNFVEKIIKQKEKNLFLNKRKSYKKKILINNKMFNYSDANSYIKKKNDIKNQSSFSDKAKNKLKKLNSAKINHIDNIINKKDGIKTKLNYIKKIEVNKNQNLNLNLNKSTSKKKEEIYIDLSNNNYKNLGQTNKFTVFLNKSEKGNKVHFSKDKNPFTQIENRKSLISSSNDNTKKDKKNIQNNQNTAVLQENSKINQQQKIRTLSHRNTKNLSKKEKAFYLLSKSPVLRLIERMIFGRSTQNIREIQSVSDILNRNKILLKNKIKELEEEINECENKINSPFNASKTAEITFNFILTKDEEEFKRFIIFMETDEEEKEYYIYMKVIYLLFDESYEGVEIEKLDEHFYEIINKKGFKNIKDYLYHIYIKKNENINIIHNIDKINELLKEAPNIVGNHFNNKICRFVLFTSFLISEIVEYGNGVKNAIELKIRTKGFIDIIENKLLLYESNNIKENK